MLKARSLAALGNAALALATFSAVALTADRTAAQCSPWTKWGMHQVTGWAPGSTLTLGDPEQTGAAIAITFRQDDACGVALSTITHRGTRKDGTSTRLDYATDPPPNCPKALWTAVFRPEFSQEPEEVGPDSADEFRIWVDDADEPRVAVFRWDGLNLANPNCDSFFWMELRVEIDCHRPDRSVWNSRMGRIQRPGCTDRYTLDEVRAPIVYTRQPGAGLLSRILVPVAGAFILPDTNLPMRLWQIVGYDLDLEHPARGQQMQFSAIYSGDPTDIPAGNHVISSFRKILYFTTEDDRGYYKRFQHKVVDDGTGVLYYRWASAYFPTYGPLPFVNYHRSRYPAVISAIEGRSDAYWYDVADRYRTFVDRERWLPKIGSRFDVRNPDFQDASVFVATSVQQPVVADIAPIWDTLVDAAEVFRDAFPGADGDPTPTFMEWQKWLKGNPVAPPADGRLPEDPIGPNFNPRPFTGGAGAQQEPPTEVADAVDRARSADINISVYTLPIQMNQDDWPDFDSDWFLFERDGSMLNAPTGNVVDYGNLAVPFWFASNLYDNIFDTLPNLGGVFFDVLAGSGSYLRFPQDPTQLFSLRRYNGGASYIRGVRLLFDLVRARIALSKPSRQHPDIPFIPGEVAMEFTAEKADFGQHGVKPLPFHMWTNPLFDQLAGVPTLSPQASNPSPPLWNAVYHEWVRAEGLTVALNGSSVSALLGGGQNVFPGITWQRWGEYVRMVHAMFWFQGMKPLSFQYFFDQANQDVLVRRNGAVEVRDPTNPAQVQTVDFLKRLHASLDRDDEAGQLLTRGRMERPLQVPGLNNPFVVSASLNPGFEVNAFVDPGLLGARHFYETFFSSQPYPVPHVLSAVWREPGRNGRLGLVFVNWSDQPSAWEGTFDPADYDCVGTQFTITGVRPDGAGVEEYTVASGDGPTVLAWNPTTAGVPLVHHGEPGAGLMPPRSVQVFFIE